MNAVSERAQASFRFYELNDFLPGCLHCNLPLTAIDKSAVIERLPPLVAQTHARFCWCEGCDRVYWEGSHWQRMREPVARYAGD